MLTRTRLSPRSGSLTRLLGGSLFALLLIFAQQQATLHWLGHAIDATHAKPGHPLPADPCTECAGLSALNGAAPSVALALPAGTAAHQRATSALPAGASEPLRLAYRSRAPPASN